MLLSLAGTLGEPVSGVGSKGERSRGPRKLEQAWSGRDCRAVSHQRTGLSPGPELGSAVGLGSWCEARVTEGHPDWQSERKTGCE